MDTGTVNERDIGNYDMGKESDITKKNFVEIYTKRLLQTILNVKFKQIDVFSDFTKLIEFSRILIDENNNSLLKQQLIKFSALGLECIEQEKTTLKIDVEGFYNKFVCFDISYSAEEFERNVNIYTMNMMNIHCEKIGNEKMVLSKQEAEEFISFGIEQIIEDIETEIKKWNVEALFYNVFMISSVLAMISSVIYTRLVLKENVMNVINGSEDIGLIIRTILEMPDDELKIVSSLIGQEKMNTDTLFNIISNIYHMSANVTDVKEEPVDILSLYTKSAVLIKMQQYQDSLALLYEKNYFLYIQDYIIFENDYFQEYLKKYFDEIINYRLPEEIDANLQLKYKNILGYCVNDLMEFMIYLTEKLQSYSQNGIKIMVYGEDDLINEFSRISKIDTGAAKQLINAIMLLDSKKSVDYKNKLSIFPLARRNDGKILVSLPLLMQAYPILGKRMSQRSFSNDKRMQKYFDKVYDEYYLEKIKDIFQKKNINCQINVHLDQISDKKVKEFFVKGITREFDLTFSLNKRLYIVEYKNWATWAFSMRTMLNEYKKVENVVKEHLKAFEIIKENFKIYEKVFDCNKEEIDNITLIMVFQKPNAYYHLNHEDNVLAYSFNEFIEVIEHNNF